MKFLFSQNHSFAPEKFGRVIFDEIPGEKETIKKPVGVPQEVWDTKMEASGLGSTVERNALSESVEEKEIINSPPIIKQK